MELILAGVADAAKPVLFATLIILVAFIPLFTMQGVPGKIFAPMSVTYGFALTGALIFALVFAPVLGSFTLPRRWQRAEGNLAQLIFSPLLRPRSSNALRLSRFTWLVAFTALGGA